MGEVTNPEEPRRPHFTNGGWFTKLLILIIMVLIISVVAINLHMISYSKRYILSNDEHIKDPDALIILGAYVFSWRCFLDS